MTIFSWGTFETLVIVVIDIKICIICILEKYVLKTI